MLRVSDITIEKLRNSELINELPELYDLKDVIENNDWHNDDSTLNHTLTVVEKLLEIEKSLNENVKSYLDQKIDKNTRRDILFIAAIFHDIGKKEACKQVGMETSFAGHEEFGSFKVRGILDRFELSEREKEVIVKIIKNHDEIHTILDYKDGTLDKRFEEVKNKLKDIYLELVLLTLADTMGCQLKDNLPDEFEFRVNYYKKILENY